VSCLGFFNLKHTLAGLPGLPKLARRHLLAMRWEFADLRNSKGSGNLRYLGDRSKTPESFDILNVLTHFVQLSVVFAYN
jgi:hypothetical protein